VRHGIWDTCYKRYAGLVRSAALFALCRAGLQARASQHVEDVVQTVFLDLPRSARGYRDLGRARSAQSWLARVAVLTAFNSARDVIRWNRYVSIDDVVDDFVALIDPISDDDLIDIRRWREALRESDDPHQRMVDEVLNLRIQGFDNAEIGARLGRSKKTVANLMSKLRRELTAILSRSWS
jgi:RNA polymerase sigma factor (sigma-70 family)